MRAPVWRAARCDILLLVGVLHEIIIVRHLVRPEAQVPVYTSLRGCSHVTVKCNANKSYSTEGTSHLGKQSLSIRFLASQSLGMGRLRQARQVTHCSPISTIWNHISSESRLSCI